MHSVQFNAAFLTATALTTIGVRHLKRLPHCCCASAEAAPVALQRRATGFERGQWPIGHAYVLAGTYRSSNSVTYHRTGPLETGCDSRASRSSGPRFVDCCLGAIPDDRCLIQIDPAILLLHRVHRSDRRRNIDQFWSTYALSQRYRMSTLDEITKEKQRVGEALARVDAQCEQLVSQLRELEATERVLARYTKGPQGRKTSSKCPPT
jgi:hypothetical protein